jgi:hypothetical protein
LGQFVLWRFNIAIWARQEGFEMSFWFWCLAIGMLALAVGFLAIPLVKNGSGNRIPQVAMFVPLVTLGLYTQIGSLGAIDAGGSQAQPDLIGTTPNSGSRRERVAAPISGLVSGLRDRLEQTPDDADGWLLLARSYEHLGRRSDAELAYEHARSLGKSDNEPGSLPRSSSALPSAIPAGDRAALRGRVSLSLDAASRVRPDDTVFVFARESANHRMPVVALRKSISDLPLEFVLTDRQAMVPGTRLADFETLVVSAQVSRSGNARDTIDGLAVSSTRVSPVHEGEIELLITAGPHTREYGDE